MPAVLLVFHQRCGERVLERVAVLDGDVLDGLHRVEVLCQRDRQPRVAQLAHEAAEQVQHDRLPSGSRRRLGLDRQFLGGLLDVGLVLEQDVQRLLGLLDIDVLDAQQHQCPRPVQRPLGRTPTAFRKRAP